MTNGRIRIAPTCCLLVTLMGNVAHAQSQPPTPAPPPDRSDGWNTATNILAVSSMAVELLLPRTFFSDPDVTAGWKGRWHVSALAPVMTLAAIGLLNETTLKDAFGGLRPGCTDSTQPGCGSFGFMSTQSYLAGSSLGEGVAVFLVDTLRWSCGQVHVGALIGEVGVPLVIAPITAFGRTDGNWETGGQAWGSLAIGLGVGLALGFLYASLQRPECGYTGNLICW
ncbi:MAG TPA: hypothetical protein VN894_06510 [Polyangiaceae bacterium]|nr:hypothetical protein [Polyangiaceae bacterium]